MFHFKEFLATFKSFLCVSELQYHFEYSEEI